MLVVNRNTMASIPKNSTNLKSMLGSLGSPSIINPSVVKIEEKIKIFKMRFFILI